MFQARSADFDRRVVAIADHLRAIEKELSRLGQRAGRQASARTSAASDQIAETIGPILSEIGDRFLRGRRVAVDEAANFGNEAIKVGARVGSDALDRISSQAKQRPLLTLAVAIGVGLLIGAAVRRN
jgi:ElaB/YqjD/DUF883 family membrane-anchored ribosome-binding protein